MSNNSNFCCVDFTSSKDCCVCLTSGGSTVVSCQLIIIYLISIVLYVVERLMVPGSWRFGAVSRPGQPTLGQLVVNLHLCLMFLLTQ